MSGSFLGAGDSLDDKVVPVLGTGQAILHVPSIQNRLKTDDKETAEEAGQR